MMTMSRPSTVSEKETTIRKHKFNESRREEYIPVTRSSSSSSALSASISASQNESSIYSVPSLYNALQPVKREQNDDNQLAFTTEDLQIGPKPSTQGMGAGLATVGYQHPIVPSPAIGSMKSNKKRFVRHGLMMASTSDLLDSINSRPGTMPSSGGAIMEPPKNTIVGNSSMSLNSGTSSSQLRARPTVTTILRLQHVLEKAEKKEKDKLESLMVSNSALLEVDSLSKEHEKKQAEEAKAAESKRLLQARLAYEKAIAASRKVADEKQKIAESTRQKEKEWQSILEKQRELEKERRKAMTESLQKANSDSRKAFDEMLRAKQLKATKVKQETEQLQAEARLKKQQEEIRRQDKIQQIQAAKLALKRTKETMGNPNQFYRSIAIPETQIKLRLQKEEEKRKLQETRQKIQQAKQMKSVKLIRAMKKIQSCESLARKQQQEQPLKQRPVSSIVNAHQPFSFPAKASFSYLKKDANNNADSTSNNTASSTKDGEINEMLEQLKQLRAENYQQRVQEKEQRAHAAATFVWSRPTVKIIGARVDKNSNDNAASKSNNFYRHRSHYGIHDV